MRHKRWFKILALLFPLALLAAACGGDDDDSASSGDKSTTTTTAKAGGKNIGLVYDLGGRGDQSFNDAAAAGLEKAKSEFGISAKELEPDQGGENREELMRLLADQGSELIFGIGFLFADSITAAAPDYPDTQFAIVDSVVDAPNVASLTFAENEGSFLVGAAAALKSKAGHIGFVGGVNVPLIKKFEAGYIAGAKAVNPDIKIDSQYLTQPPDFSGFGDPAKGKTAAEGMFQKGADVVYHAAGGSGGGVFTAAKAAGPDHWAIGVDSDQALTAPENVRDVILTSMLKKVDVAVYDFIKSAADGKELTGNQVYDLAKGGVDYATTGGHIDDIKSKLDDYKQQIIDKKITVPTTP
jgi:basic membrane protein A